MYMYFFNFCHMFWCLLDEMRNDLQTLNLLRSLIYLTQYRLYLRLWRNISRGRHSQLMSRMELKQDRLCRRVGFAQIYGIFQYWSHLAKLIYHSTVKKSCTSNWCPTLFVACPCAYFTQECRRLQTEWWNLHKGKSLYM